MKEEESSEKDGCTSWRRGVCLIRELPGLLCCCFVCRYRRFTGASRLLALWQKLVNERNLTLELITEPVKKCMLLSCETHKRI